MKTLLHKIPLLALTFALSFVFSASGYSQTFDGFALYNLQNNNTTYLIDENGNIAHTWNNSVPCNYAVLLMPTGNIMRGGVNSGNQINGAAVGGMVQEIDPAGNVVWSYTYSTSAHVSHHDITLMPNGNVLLTAWEVKNSSELSGHGYTGNSNEKWPTHFIEVEQNGTGGQIVWEWHMWDHMIQDQNSSLSNYGVVADHPELMDVNVATSSSGGGPGGPSGDWFHVNGVHYNAALDQIAFSSRFLSEVFIIDHSTTTLEAAGHTGGNAGMGGDLLYRWGNPANYGATGAAVIPGPVHDVRWITNDGRPNGGFLQFFNNKGISNNSSSVDAIETPLVGFNYTKTAGQPYDPVTYSWRHNALVYGSGQSASNRMRNGNTFVNVSNRYMYEVDSVDNIIWQYNAGPAKAFKYHCDYPGITALLGSNPCGLTGIDDAGIEDFGLFPNPSTGVVNISGLHLDNRTINIKVCDMLGNTIEDINNVSQVDLSNQPNGLYFITVSTNEGKGITKKMALAR